MPAGCQFVDNWFDQEEFAGPGGLWTVREYLAVGDGVAYVLGLCTTEPENDSLLFDEIGRRFELLILND